MVSSTVNSVINPIPKQPDPVVITIQHKLSKLGYETGLADGFAGRRTTEAIKSFQRDHNLIENGIISALLMEQINQIYNSGYPTISQSQAVSNSTERAQMVSEERRVNLEACLDGHYPMSCRRELLTPAETKQADAAERRVNLKICLDGSFSMACKRGLLTSEELVLVEAVEQNTPHGDNL